MGFGSEPSRSGRVMQLGKLGVWAPMDALTAAEGAEFATRVESWGYSALWLPESRGRNVLVHSSWLLANTSSLIVAPGIANIYARDAMAMANGQRALAEQSGGRFLLGIGVSRPPTAPGRGVPAVVFCSDRSPGPRRWSRGCAATITASRSRRCVPI